MTRQLIVTEEIVINASSEKVWEVLTLPKYVAQWDELPEDYPKEPMTAGSKVVWDLPNGEQSITTIIKAEAEKELIIDLHGTGWKIKPEQGEVAYRYLLENLENGTKLFIEIGNFALLDQGEAYYEASVEFAEASSKIIKTLAENEIQ
ncbi:SRPBCC domain-containing protein [Oceanobacillus jeddahense]|uniref:SRPBCC domain-containing protein n=1 Tax=Oceanobacillus jeddahense TaxID=1462527 RepID=A0ABY5JWF7_9BACI|nr:SRPBCC domain-containing protein [Oceanobacillus jeddahense]UUI04575.1 SRPBCC domain-containing protein [Oceanobacillus jeddahense]